MVAIQIDDVFLACLTVIWVMLLYHVILCYGGYRYSVRMEQEIAQMAELSSENLPQVTVLIPAHNEALVIDRTLRAVACMDYPEKKLTVLCLNDNSTDGTGEIARKTAASLGAHVQVVDVPPSRGGRGKSAVLNYGLEIAQGEVLAVYDADNTPERSALLYLVHNLVKREDLGAVIGKFRTRNRYVNLLTRFINLETIFFQWSTQAGRWHLYSLATIPGTNFVVWKELVQRIGGWDEKALTEDTELSIRIYLQNQFIKMVPYSVTWEEEPSSWKVWFKQRTRWARGNLYVLKKYFFPLLLRGKWRLFLDMFYLMGVYFLFLSSVSISLLIFIAGSLGVTYVSLQGPFNFLWVLAALLFVVELGISLTAEPGEDRGKNLLVGFLMYFSYTQMWLLVMFNAVWQGIASYFQNEKTFWHKTERTG